MKIMNRAYYPVQDRVSFRSWRLADISRSSYYYCFFIYFPAHLIIAFHGSFLEEIYSPLFRCRGVPGIRSGSFPQLPVLPKTRFTKF